MFIFRFLRASLFFVTAAVGVSGQGTSAVVLEAESGVLGGNFITGASGGVTYITDPFNGTGASPGGAGRVASYTVTFPAAGTYELYARVWVGPALFGDDSFFYGNGFGTKSPTDAAQWITANGLASVGASAPGSFVTGAGNAAGEVWKWIKLSEFNGGEVPITFTVPAGALTQTFQIGARENGLWIDQFAFGPESVRFTVANLDNRQPGTPTTAHLGPPLAAGKPKFLGNVWSSGQLTNYTRFWNQVTPENAGKWASVEGTRNAMNWAALDSAYALAKTNGFPFRFHVLIWGNQQPAWIESLPPAEQLVEIRQWFSAVAARYPQIDYLEVVNEPLNDPPRGPANGNYIDALGGDGATGWDWILNAFRMAREIFPPETKLMINEYSVTNGTQSMQRYRTIIQLLQAEGLIDVIGVQGHAFETTVNPATTRSNLNALAATGLPIQITEMDVDGPTEEAQLASYQSIFPIFWEHPSVIGVTLWGWRDGMWRSEQGAQLVRTDGSEKPALVWLKTYVQNHLPVVVPGQSLTVPAGAANGTGIGVLQATDADAGAILQPWTITAGNGGRFALNPGTGHLSVANTAQLGAAGTSYPLTVTVSDGIGTSMPTVVTVRVIVPDTDGDGLPDDFEQLHGGGSTTGLDPALDLDGDGLPALLEFAFGLRPDLPDSAGAPGLGTVEVDSQQYLALTYRRADRARDYVDLIVTRSTDLSDPAGWRADQTVTISVEPAPDDPGVDVVTERALSPLSTQGGEFLRIEAVPLRP